MRRLGRSRFYRVRELGDWRDFLGGLWCRVVGHRWMTKYDGGRCGNLCTRCRYYDGGAASGQLD